MSLKTVIAPGCDGDRLDALSCCFAIAFRGTYRPYVTLAVARCSSLLLPISNLIIAGVLQLHAYRSIDQTGRGGAVAGGPRRDPLGQRGHRLRLQDHARRPPLLLLLLP